jgi:hypothetical protein
MPQKYIDSVKKEMLPERMWFDNEED